jgi:glutamate-1-semialdehyde 2,1-aminomutase
MTGFRVAPGGAQERYGVRPDLTTLGKVIGAGLPVGAYGGRADLMRQIAPEGPVYQAGTLSGNPLAMAAGIAQLRHLRETASWEALSRRAARLVEGVEGAARDAGIVLSGASVGSMFGLYYRETPPHDFAGAKEGDAVRFARFFRAALARGLFFAPSAFEAGFVSTAHEDSDVEETIQRAGEALREVAD